MINGLSLFANVGVAETYLKDIGVNMVLANELIEERAKFYQHLYPSTEVITGDITEDNLRNSIVNKSKQLNVDFIIATPPCQGMSIAGKLDQYDERNQLIYYAIDVIKRVKPNYVFLENVPRQLKTKIRFNNKISLIPEYIHEVLGDEYDFNGDNIIKAMDYGVPQIRERNIILLTKKTENISWSYPAKEKAITLREALDGIPSLDPYLREGYEETIKMFPDFEEKKERGITFSKWHKPPTHAKRMVEAMQHTPSGDTAFNNNIYYPKRLDGKKVRGHSNHYRRHSWDRPARTITQNNGVMSSLTCVHPGYKIKGGTEEERLYSDARVFSIYELLLVSSLPTDWDIPDWATENLIRSVVGEGIPPLLVKKIVAELIAQLKEVQTI